MRSILAMIAGLAVTATALPNFWSRDLDPNIVNSSCASVSQAYREFDEAVQSNYVAGQFLPEGLLKLPYEEKKLEDTLRYATSVTTNNGTRLGLADSVALLESQMTLEVQLIFHCILMVMSKPAFDSVLGVISVRKTILDWLNTQKDLTVKFENAVAATMSPLVAPIFRLIIQAVSMLFDLAIATYEVPAPAGHAELPDGALPDGDQLPTVSQVPATTPSLVSI